MTQIDPVMFAAANRIAGFIQSGDEKELQGVFARDVTIIENFSPHVFRDVASWRAAMREHVKGLSDLRYTLSQPVDFSRTGDRAFFVVPVIWTGNLHGRQFREFGGKSIVFQNENTHWRVAAYAWAVTEMRFL